MSNLPAPHHARGPTMRTKCALNEATSTLRAMATDSSASSATPLARTMADQPSGWRNLFRRRDCDHRCFWFCRRQCLKTRTGLSSLLVLYKQECWPKTEAYRPPLRRAIIPFKAHAHRNIATVSLGKREPGVGAHKLHMHVRPRRHSATSPVAVECSGGRGGCAKRH